MLAEAARWWREPTVQRLANRFKVKILAHGFYSKQPMLTGQLKALVRGVATWLPRFPIPRNMHFAQHPLLHTQ